jgi:galactoside O-acetyltransferase
MAFLSSDQLRDIGFASIGLNILISDKASIYGAEKIHLGNNIRIDDYCVLSAGDGGFYIGNNIHIAVYSSLIGGGKITLGDYCNISSRVSIYSSNDDYSGNYMTNPMVPSIYTNVLIADVMIGKHVIIASGSIILPNVNIMDGVAIGALSLIKDNCEEFTIYAGCPSRVIGKRSKELLNKETEFNSANK